MSIKGKAPSIALVFGGGHKPEPEAEAEEASGKGNEEGKLAAGEDLLEAVKANDAQGAADAIANLFAILESEPHDESGEE